MKLNQKGFGLVEGLIAGFVGLLIVGVTSYALVSIKHKNDQKKRDSQITSQASDDSIDSIDSFEPTSSPSQTPKTAQAATPDTETKQNTNLPARKPTTFQKQGYLVIKEFSVMLPITDSALTGATYTIYDQKDYKGSVFTVIDVTTPRIEAVACKGNDAGIFKQPIYVSTDKDQAVDSQMGGEASVKKIGDNYYAFSHSTGDGICDYNNNASDEAALRAFRISAYDNGFAGLVAAQ